MMIAELTGDLYAMDGFFVSDQYGGKKSAHRGRVAARPRFSTAAYRGGLVMRPQR